jgi:hypothetical protein
MLCAMGPIMSRSKDTMKLSLLLAPLILAQLSCYRKVSYQLLGDVTKIVVMDQNQMLKEITDKEHIAQIVKSIDQKRHGWYMPIQGTPIPKIKLLLYNDVKFKGSFGIGEDFFWTQREGRFDAMPATDEELQTFLNTVGVDKKRLYRGFGELDPQLPPPECAFPPKKVGK